MTWLLHANRQYLFFTQFCAYFPNVCIRCCVWLEPGSQLACVACRMAKGKAAWLQLLRAVHERVKLQRDVDEVARCQLATLAGDEEGPAKPAEDRATGSAPKKTGGATKKAGKGSGGNAMGAMLRNQVAKLTKQNDKRSGTK